MINLTVMSVLDYKRFKKRKNFNVSYGFHETPFGRCLIGLHSKSICHFSFVNKSESYNMKVLKRDWPGAVFVKETKETGRVVNEIFGDETKSFEVLLKGTSFESKVWHTLLSISKGKTVSYEDVAVMIGNGKAVRAVANAVAKNPVSYLVPCHRVIKKDKSIHKYGWGADIKKKILDYEKQ